MGKSTKVANVPNAPAFSAFRTASQSLTTGAFTKVQCNGEEFDTANAYDAVTNFRFTPQASGYYQVNGGVLVNGATLTIGILMIYKNGGLWKRGNDIRATMSGYAGLTVSGLVYMNGTTDYLELYAYAEGTSLELQGTTATDNYFQACLVRPA